MESKETIGELLKSSKELLKIIELDIDQSSDERDIKKFNEVIGFCEQVVRIIETQSTRQGNCFSRLFVW